jgi:hypothetical protein
MADVSFFDPKQEAEVKRRRMMAQQMMQQGQQTPNEMVSGIVVKKSPLEGLAKALQTGYSGYQSGKADRIQAEDAQKKQELLARALGGYNQDPNAAAQMLLESPATSELGVGLMTDNARSERDYQQQMQMFKERMPFELDLARQKAQIQSQYRAPTASPSSVQEYNFYNSLPPEEQARFLNVKRATLEKGITYDDNGNAVPVSGYNDVLQGQKYSEQSGKNVSDLEYNPQIKKAEVAAALSVSPLPTAIVQNQDELLDTINTSEGIINKTDRFVQQIDKGELDLGLMANLSNKAKNNLGMSTEESRNLASFQATLEQLRNDSLRLNNGVQTDGDAQRAWNELIANINDPQVVKQRLQEISEINKRGSQLKRVRLNTMRSEFGKEPLRPNSPDNIGSMGQGSNPAITQPVDQITPVLQGGGDPLTPQEQEELDQLRARFK